MLGNNIVRCIAYMVFHVLTNIVKNIEVNVKKKQWIVLHGVLHDVLGFVNSIQRCDKILVFL